MFGNTFGGFSMKFGGSFPVWKDVLGKLDGGGVFDKLPKGPAVIPAATPVYVEKVGGVAKTLAFYEVLEGSAGTKVLVRVGDGLPLPEAGEVLMKVPATLDGVGVGIEVKDVAVSGNEATVTLSGAIDGLTAGDVLTIAAGKGEGVGMRVKNLSGLTQNDVHVREGVKTATCAVVWSGKVYADRIQPIPEIFKARVPNILFEKEV
jgi:hypothetical protein